jgi:hypothetical protein
VDDAISACNQNQLALGSALEAIRMCRESHLEFLRTVNRYNLDIAEYAIAVAPMSHPAPELASMLIKTRQPKSDSINAVASSDLAPVSTRQPTLGSAPRSMGASPRNEASSSFGSVPIEATNPVRGSLREVENSKGLEPWAQSDVNSAAIGSGVDQSATQAATKTANLQPPPIAPVNQAQPKTGGGGSFSFGNR